LRCPKMSSNKKGGVWAACELCSVLESEPRTQDITDYLLNSNFSCCRHVEHCAQPQVTDPYNLTGYRSFVELKF